MKLNFTCSLVNQRASSISFLSTLISVDTATAKQPIIREEGIGHGWQEMYWTWATLTPASSSTSLRTASSMVSPNQKGQRTSSSWKYSKQRSHAVLWTDSKDLKLPKAIIYKDLVHRSGQRPQHKTQKSNKVKQPLKQNGTLKINRSNFSIIIFISWTDNSSYTQNISTMPKMPEIRKKIYNSYNYSWNIYLFICN